MLASSSLLTRLAPLDRMSNPQQHKTLFETSYGKNSAVSSRNKFTFTGANDQPEQLSKLIGSQPELNNNSIILPSLETLESGSRSVVVRPTLNSQHHLELSKQSLSDFKRLSATAINMDQIGSKNSPGQAEVMSTRTETNLNSLSNEASASSPIYPNILNVPASRRNQSPPPHSQQTRQQRLPLKKQPVAQQTTEPEAIASVKTLSSGNKKLSSMSCNSSRDLDYEDQEDDEQEDDELSERLPFGANKLRSSGRLAGEPQRACLKVSPGKKQSMPLDSHKVFREYNNSKKAHSKISMNDNMRPPSFNTSCHPETLGGRKFESWQGGYTNCACSGSSQYLKPDVSQVHWRGLMQEKKPSRTKSMHLVLKSIILILLTLILAMLLLGFVAASHYLPQMFDKLLNASRSFNVTISG